MTSLNGLKVPLPYYHSTILPDFDFETYSESGYQYNSVLREWESLPGASEKGLKAVNTVVYAEHPTTEVLCLAYNLKDGSGPKQWRPGETPPWDLINYLLFGGLIEAFNVFFEFQIWNKVCVKKYGFPKIELTQLRCAQAKARASALPPSLEKAGTILDIEHKKLESGTRLLNIFSKPRDPTKTNDSKRNYLTNCKDSKTFLEYNLQDILAESEISQKTPDLIPHELEFWQLDQKINNRGIAVDLKNVENCIKIVEKCYIKYDEKLAGLTSGDVKAASETKKLKLWVNCQLYPDLIKELNILNDKTTLNKLLFLCSNFTERHLLKIKDKLKIPDSEKNLHSAIAETVLALKNKKEKNAIVKELEAGLVSRLPAEALFDMQKETLEEFVTRDNLPENVKRAVEIRQLLGSASIKKLYSFKHQATTAGRLHNLFVYHKARTGRAAGKGPQPQNLPSAIPNISECLNCGQIFDANETCVFCKSENTKKYIQMSEELVERVFKIISSNDLNLLQHHFKNPIKLISGCLRSMLIAGPGKDLIGTDYSAIEAVVLACISEEKWRIDVFKGHGKIYEMSASKITGVPFEEFLKYKKEHGEHHPLRKKIGKIAELASGFGGWIDSWKRFNAGEFFTDEEIKKAILAWRKASPNIVRFWGGQPDYKNDNYYGVEGNVILAIKNPGVTYKYKIVQFVSIKNTLYIILPSGRRLTYQNVRLENNTFREGKLSIVFDGWNTNSTYGAQGWITMRTYGGRLTENIASGIARDILANGMINAEKAGYEIVSHVHDELVVEVPEGFGSIEGLEKEISRMPEWAQGWPVFAVGGFRGKRYRKN